VWGQREGLPLGYDAFPESFFHALKTALVHHEPYQNRDEAKKALFDILRPFITIGG